MVPTVTLKICFRPFSTRLIILIIITPKGFNYVLLGKPNEIISNVEVGYRNEDQSTAIRNTNYSLCCAGQNLSESNPPIQDGVLREMWLEARYGQEPFPIPILPRNYVQLDLNHSAPMLRSSFDYTKVTLQGEYHYATFLRSLLLPPSLMVRFASGTAFGALPPQQYYRFDAPLLGYAPSGTLRSAQNE